MSLRKHEDFRRGNLWRFCRREEIQPIQKMSKVRKVKTPELHVWGDDVGKDRNV